MFTMCSVLISACSEVSLGLLLSCWTFSHNYVSVGGKAEEEKVEEEELYDDDDNFFT